MENYRVLDLRRSYSCSPPLCDQVSMCYYLREQPILSENIKATTMVLADKKGLKIKFN